MASPSLQQSSWLSRKAGIGCSMLTATIVKGRPGKSISGRIRSSHPYLAAVNAAVAGWFPYMPVDWPLWLSTALLTHINGWLWVTQRCTFVGDKSPCWDWEKDAEWLCYQNLAKKSTTALSVEPPSPMGCTAENQGVKRHLFESADTGFVIHMLCVYKTGTLIKGVPKTQRENQATKPFVNLFRIHFLYTCWPLLHWLKILPPNHSTSGWTTGAKFL